MASYRLSGIVLASEVPLDGYEAALVDQNETPDVDLRCMPNAPQPDLVEILAPHSVDTNGQPLLSVAELGDDRLLRMHGAADFRIDRLAQQVICTPVPGCPEDVLAQAVVDRLLPHLLSQRGVPALHASVVELVGLGAVGFLGSPGSGKSTIAGALSPPGRLLCDDCAAVRLDSGEAFVHPSYGFVRLRHDSAAALEGEPNHLKRAAQPTDKWRLPRPSAIAPSRMVALYSLTEHDEPRPALERLRPRDAIAELARHLYRLDFTARWRLAQELTMLDELTRAVPVSWLRYRRRFDELADVAEAVVADAARG